MTSVWLEWYYLIYLLPAAVAVFVLLASGLAGHDGGDAGGADVHADMHFHMDGLHGAHIADGHAHAHMAHADAPDGDADSAGAAARLFGFFGVGRAPITMVAGSLMIGWGLFGLAATEILRESFGESLGFIPIAMAVAGVGALVTAKAFGELTARLMPGDESFAIGPDDLIGLTATVIYPVSDALGRVHVWDRNRTLHAKAARLETTGNTLPRGEKVLITGLDSTRQRVLVRPAETAHAPETTPDAL